MKNKWNKRAPSHRALVWACSAPVAALLLVSATTPALRAAQRPIEDFLSTQGTYVWYSMGWIDPQPKYGANLAVIDYAGLEGAVLEYYGYPMLGTTFSGTVIERPLADGRAEVDVVLNTRNALAYAVYTDFAGYTEYLFGHNIEDVYYGASLALGDCTLKLKFINTAPGAPLPDFWELYLDPQPGVKMLSAYFIGRAEGLLADDSPGHMEITQVGLMVASPTLDGWPVEHIMLKRVRK